ncbi:MAG: hypothetical protein NC299_18065 [Lachnospiraceae bacterium]|nr:hypothetical protein [Lachnospiraceae bacterium]
MSDKRVTVSGITPAAEGDDWFCIDKSGVFSVDKTIIATVWLVGGGCDGGDGKWISYEPILNEKGKWKIKPGTGSGTSYAGNGGDGGYVHVIDKIKIKKSTDCTSVIANVNDVSGTNLTVNGSKYSCGDAPHIARKGGKGAGVTNKGLILQPANGAGGMITPYQVVGSSGGGGLSCNGFNETPDDGNVSVISFGGEGAGDGSAHRESGSAAANYGGGGGGGCICGHNEAVPHNNAWEGGKGERGCIIVQYEIYQNSLVVTRDYDKNCETRKNCTTDYASSSGSSHNCCGS